MSETVDEREDLNQLSLEEMFDRIRFSKLEVLTSGDGWVGKRYRLTSSNYGTLEAVTMDGLRKQIVQYWAWMLRHH